MRWSGGATRAAARGEPEPREDRCCHHGSASRGRPRRCPWRMNESLQIQERKHNWGPIQVCIKRKICLEDLDDSEGENPGSCESDGVSLEGITDLESNTLVIPGQGGDEHGYFNGRVWERVSVQVVRQSEDSLEPNDAICIGAQDPHALETDLDGQYVESKLNKDPEISCYGTAS